MNITKSLRKEDVDRQWYIIDATDKVLGRLSTEVANTLRGKNKPTYTPHVDTGDRSGANRTESVESIRKFYANDEAKASLDRHNLED